MPRSGMILRFGSYAPDLHPYMAHAGAEVNVSVKNVLPTPTGYAPMEVATAVGATFTSTNTATTLGAVQFMEHQGVRINYLGTAHSLYKYSGSSTSYTASEVSKAGGYSIGFLSIPSRWEFARFENRVIAASYWNPVQTVSLSAAALFSDLITSTSTPRGDTVAVVGDFLVLGYINDGGTRYENRVWWSAIGDPTDFDVDVTTQCDFQDLRGEGGPVRKIVAGRDYATIFRQSSIWRMTYVGSPTIFQFDEIDTTRGVGSYANSVVQVGEITYFLTPDGFYACDGSTTRPIGAKRVDQFVSDRVGAAATVSTKNHVVGVQIPYRTAVCWLIRPIDTNPPISELLIYDWLLDKWSMCDENVFAGDGTARMNYIFQIYNADINSTSANRLAVSGRISGSNPKVRLQVFGSIGASTAPSTIETGEMKLDRQGRRCLLTEIVPVSDHSATATSGLKMQVGYRNTQGEAVTYTPTLSSNAIGIFPAHIDSRYFRFRLLTGSGNAWTFADGIERLKFTPRGHR